MNSNTPRTDNLAMALKCVPHYAKSKTHDFEMALAKCRELELELADCQAACLEYQRQAQESWERERNAKNQLTPPPESVC